MNRIEVADDGRTVRVYPSRWRLMTKALHFILVGFLIGAVLSGAAFMPLLGGDSDRLPEIVIALVFAPIIYIPIYVTAGLTLLGFGIARLVRRTPRIEITESGITFFRRKPRQIAWQDVSAVRIREFWQSITVSELRSTVDGPPKILNVSSPVYELELSTLKYVQYRISKYCPAKVSPPDGYDPWEDELKYLSPVQFARLARESFGPDAAAFVEKRRAMDAGRLLGPRHAVAWAQVAEALAKGG